MNKFWMKNEVELLLNHYGTTPKEEILKIIPNRKWTAICTKASKLGVSRKEITIKKPRGGKGEFVKNGEGKKRIKYEFICKICGRAFSVPPSRVKQAQKHNHNISFCCRECQKIGLKGAGNPFYGKSHTQKTINLIRKKNIENPGNGRPPKRIITIDGTIESISLNFNSKRNMRKIVNKCEICGYDKEKDILVIHHKSGNRKDNSTNNLIVLCPTCHALEHLKKWREEGFAGRPPLRPPHFSNLFKEEKKQNG